MGSVMMDSSYMDVLRTRAKYHQCEDKWLEL